MSAITDAPDWLASYGKFRLVHDRICTLLTTAPSLLHNALEDHMADLRRIDLFISTDQLSPSDIQWNFDKAAAQRDALVKQAVEQKRELAALVDERHKLLERLRMRFIKGQLIDRSGKVVNLYNFTAHRPAEAVAA